MAEDGAELFEELMRFKPEGLSPNAWAVRAGVGRTIWADLRRHGNPSRRTLSKLLEAAGSSLAEFEALRAGRSRSPPVAAELLAEPRSAWGRAPIPPLPLLATRPAGLWGDQRAELVVIGPSRVIGRLPRPQSLADDREAYAITVTGESMWPRFRPGRHLAVSPAARIVAGDDVLVTLANGRGALLGELRSQSHDQFALRQFNPAIEFTVTGAEAAAVHKIVGELI